VAETWLVLTEVEGVHSVTSGETEEDAVEMAFHALKAKGAAKVTAAGVIKIDHSIRAASLVTYRRAGQSDYGKTEGDAEKPKPNTAAYDSLVPFGYDLDRELKIGRQPPEERLVSMMQKLGIPVILKKKVDAPPPKSDKPSLAENKMLLPIAAVVFVVVLIVVAVLLIKK